MPVRAGAGAALLLLGCGACGVPTYTVDGVYIEATPKGSPSRACTRDAFKWLAVAYTCSRSPWSPSAVASISWRSSPWWVWHDGRRRLLAGSGARVADGRWLFVVAWVPGLVSSALAHEWHHAALAADTGDVDAQHNDTSWACVARLQHSTPLASCMETQ